MAFWGKHDDDDLPPELKDKTPKEIAAALKKADEIRTAAEKTLADAKEMDAKLTAQTTEYDAMKVRMAELEANQKEPIAPVMDEPASPWTDPEKFVRDQTKATTGVALTAGLMAAKMYFMQNLTTRDQKIFKKYEKETEGVISTFAVEARVMPQSWMNAFLYVKGLHDVDIQKAESSKSDFFSETPSRGQTPEPEPTDQLTAEEEEVCRTFHYDPKSYLERKKSAVLNQSSKGAYGKYPVPTTRS